MTEETKEQDSARLEEALKALDDEKKRSQECLARLKYAQADLENLRKRYERQVDEARKYANEHIVIELLDVVDELELAVKLRRSSDPIDKLVEGVEMTLKKLEKVLKNESVSPIDCVGEIFDPSKHEAVAKVEKEDVDDCTVIEEVRKGYIMKEKVIRPSIVKVAVKPSSKSQKEMSSDE